MSQTITGKVAAFAGGIVTVTQSNTRASIDEQGNFSVPVNSNPSSQTVKLFPPAGSPYAPLMLTVSIGAGATNITAQIAGALGIHYRHLHRHPLGRKHRHQRGRLCRRGIGSIRRIPSG